MSDSLHEKDTAFRLKSGEYQHSKKQRTLNRLTPIVINGSKIPDISICQESSLKFRPKHRSVSCLPKTSLPFGKDELSIAARKSAKHVKLPAYKSYRTSYLHPCSQPPKDSSLWNPITDKLSSSKKEVTKSNDIQNQEGLHLDRCGLKTLPQVINSDQLTVLSCRQNFLSHIPDLSYLHKLEKLDLSDNRIEHISGLEKLSALRVLNLSENRVQKISGLESLHCLEILDLHKNQINKISGIQKVHHLKKINLAYNQISHMENVFGFQFLYHLNLNNNSISVVGSLIQLPSLKRLSLENNKIKRFDDVTKLFEASHLQELSLRGNPITLLPYYFETICNYLPELQMLDLASVKDHFTQMELQTFMENMEYNKTIELHHTNIGTFRQLDALVQVRNLENLMIGPDNPIVHLSSWMLYLVHRMAHLHLKTVNGKQVTVEMHQAASQMFGPVMQLMRSTFQKRRLSTILSEAQGHHTLLQSKEENPPDDFDQQTNDCGKFSITNFSAKATQVNVKADEISKEFVEEVMTKSFQALWKQRLFHLIWPSVLSEVIVETLLDFQDIDHHVKDSLDNLKKYVSCSEMEL